MAKVYLGIGSNLGDREGNCRRAVEALPEHGIRVTKRSRLHETEPWGVKDQPKFLNMAVEAETTLTPRELLAALKSIEKEMGRVESERWGPRQIDMDILLYDDLVLREPDLVIPHPLMHKRQFVLKPLGEIAPDLVHPVLKRSTRELQRAE